MINDEIGNKSEVVINFFQALEGIQNKNPNCLIFIIINHQFSKFI